MELRLYSFVNHYLSSIQQGIQTGHAAVDLVRYYDSEDSDQSNMVSNWADNHKTFIILNGGDSSGINSASDILRMSGFPFIGFRESADALDELLTCVAVVLPENIFNAQHDVTMSKLNRVTCYLWEGRDEADQPIQITYTPAHAHYKLVNLVKNARLAS